jgi:hypothetical protein
MKRVAALASHVAVVALTFLGLATGAGASTWTMTPASTVGMESTGLVGVSCASASDCTAVGSYGYEGNTQPLIERWNGTRWGLQTVPLPAGARSGGLEGVSCVSVSACVAVGWQTSSDGVQETLAEQWSGNVWTVTPTPSLSGVTSPVLTDVSCSSASACTAVGSDYDEAEDTAAPIAERWDGSKWTGQSPVAPEGPTRLSGVSCPTETDCIAVGSDFGSSGWRTVAEQWTGGGSWSVQTSANPSPNGDKLNAVSCTAATACTAVGDEGGTAGALPLAERWNGSWAAEVVPNSPEDHNNKYANTSLNSVSCFSETACFAVGAHALGDEGSELKTLAEQWSSNAWTLQPTSDPGEYQNVLQGVSCTSSSACAVVGYSTESGDFPQFLKPLAYPGTPSPPPVAPPSATTGQGRELLPPIGVELTGLVRDAGRAASWYFQYGETTSYGSSTPIETIGGEPEGQAVEARVMSGVYHGHTYHFRVVLVEEGVTRFGADKTFEGAWELYPPPATPSQPSSPPSGSQPPVGGNSPRTKTSSAGETKVGCKVPKLVSLSLTQARRHANSARCVINEVKKGKRSKRSRIVVIGQTPRPGTVEALGGHIEIRLGVPKKTKTKGSK